MTTHESPVTPPQRRIPFHLRHKVESEIQKLKREYIIEKIPEDTPTDWVSPVVIVPKQDNNIRLCGDIRAANTAIKRTRHPIPTVEAVSLELNGASIFSKLDLSQACHQLELSPTSRHITTFCTHVGLYRYKSLNYGTNVAAEQFQHSLQETLRIGMANYSSKFIMNYATITEPLRQLTRKNTRFTWTSTHQAAYEKLKHALMRSSFLYSKRNISPCRCQPVGLSAILTQKDQNQNTSIIAYASRALSQVGQQYSQTEKEALAIVWGYFHLFLFGADFTLITDHKPFRLIYNNSRSRPLARIERWFLRLQQYNFRVICMAGCENPADFLSRHPEPNITKRNVTVSVNADIYLYL